MLLNCGVGEDSWTARRSEQSILKEISPECSLEGLMLKLKLQYFGYLMQSIRRNKMLYMQNIQCYEPITSIIFLISKKMGQQAINAGEGVEKRDPSYTVGGNAN